LERVLCNASYQQLTSELERDLAPYVNNLFPLFRASTDTQRTLEIDFEVKDIEDDWYDFSPTSGEDE
jgi:hypothetical protein